LNIVDYNNKRVTHLLSVLCFPFVFLSHAENKLSTAI